MAEDAQKKSGVKITVSDEQEQKKDEALKEAKEVKETPVEKAKAETSQFADVTQEEAVTNEAAAPAQENNEAVATAPAVDFPKDYVAADGIDNVDNSTPTDEPAAKPGFPVESYNLNIKTKGRAHRAFLWVVLIIVILAVGAAAAWYFLIKSNNQTTTNNQDSIQQSALLGAELTLVDGSAQSSSDNSTWQPVAVGAQLSQGTYLKTAADGRAIITFDDGSAVRLNANSTIKIESLAANNVVFINLVGEVYSRVVASERQFSVKIGDESYQAMGTAYLTINDPTTKGVETYESTVKLKQADVEVSEGNYYYSEFTDPNKVAVLADISPDAAKLDTFLSWNYQQDKNSNEFKNKLGYLKTVYEPTPTPTPTAEQVTTPSIITLNGTAYDSGVRLSWELSNLSAPNGFKLVKSLSANPSYPGDSAVYLKTDVRTYDLSIKDGKTYHFRVCIYTGSGCSTYSNDIAVTAPLVSYPSPTGDATLSNTSEANFEWSLTGNSPNGFKLVWSTSENPTYPPSGGSAQYYSSESRSGSITGTAGTKYFVKLCLYKPDADNRCPIYSNQLEVTL